jgi:hypothetical protein
MLVLMSACAYEDRNLRPTITEQDTLGGFLITAHNPLHKRITMTLECADKPMPRVISVPRRGRTDFILGDTKDGFVGIGCRVKSVLK